MIYYLKKIMNYISKLKVKKVNICNKIKKNKK